MSYGCDLNCVATAGLIQKSKQSHSLKPIMYEYEQAAVSKATKSCVPLRFVPMPNSPIIMSNATRRSAEHLKEWVG